MSENYREYLAARVLVGSRPVTYRLLSRALKVNINTAKQMLCEFYTKQNAKKPKSIHATYLLTGQKRRVEHTNGTNGQDEAGDSFMHSSPFTSSMPQQESMQPAEELVKQTSIVLVREEELEIAKGAFEDITSIHVYSLEPGPIENLNLLSVCNQELATETSGDPLERWRLYGSIHNPYIKRRIAKFAPAPAPKASTIAPKAASKPAAADKVQEKEKAAPLKRESASEENTSGRSTPQPSTTTNTLNKSDNKPNLKREKSDIFKSFAKAKAKPKAAEKSKESTPALTEDEPMGGMSEDEGDKDDAPEVKFDEEKAAEARKARAEREEKLRKMMEEDDDEEMFDAADAAEKGSQDITQEKASDSKSAGSESAVTVQGGRRRGRRKVMKKKTTKDEDGYLVTKEEAVWESFSEDEPESKKLKPAPKPAASTAKGKKAGKQGQGSIANFFKKA